MKKTAFYSLHQNLNARMVEFAGFYMPLQYQSILNEHRCVRQNVGLFDVSHMGEIIIKGRDCFDFAQYILTNDVSKLQFGKAQYSVMCYPDGGIVDDLLVYHLQDRIMLVVNAANTQKDFEWIRSNIGSYDVEVLDMSDQFSLLALQGPKSEATLKKVVPIDLSEIAFYRFQRTNIFGADVLVSRTGYTGEIGFELYFESSIELGKIMWESLMKAGEEFGIQPIGLGARDTLRLEKGFCLYGNDIDQTTNPLEAGLGWVVKFDKKDFIGKDSLLKIKSMGIRRKLVGFIITEDQVIPRYGYSISHNGEIIGSVTSGAQSPILNKAIGLGYVHIDFCNPGTKLNVISQRKISSAEVIKLPFI